MIELKMMTGKAALRLAKEESGLTQGEIADRLGVSHAVTKRYFNINDAYMPSLEMIPACAWLWGMTFWCAGWRPVFKAGKNFPARK